MGRPPFKPTDEERRLVKSMAAMGIQQEDISRKIGVRSAKTLRKYYREELDLGAVDANYKVAQTLFHLATSGKCPAATIFWVKVRNGMREDPPDEFRQVAPPPFIVAKEQGGPTHDRA
jgi:hypothetical protein